MCKQSVSLFAACVNKKSVVVCSIFMRIIYLLNGSKKTLFQTVSSCSMSEMGYLNVLFCFFGLHFIMLIYAIITHVHFMNVSRILWINVSSRKVLFYLSRYLIHFSMIKVLALVSQVICSCVFLQTRHASEVVSCPVLGFESVS